MPDQTLKNSDQTGNSDTKDKLNDADSPAVNGGNDPASPGVRKAAVKSGYIDGLYIGTGAGIHNFDEADQS